MPFRPSSSPGCSQPFFANIPGRTNSVAGRSQPLSADISDQEMSLQSFRGLSLVAKPVPPRVSIRGFKMRLEHQAFDEAENTNKATHL